MSQHLSGTGLQRGDPPAANVPRHALVAGASGIIGRGVVARLAGQPGWQVTGLSRRRPRFLLGDEPADVEYLEADLFDRAALAAALAGRGDITHLVFAVYQQRPTPAEEVEPNLAMLRNVVEALEEVTPHLQHVTLMEGGKWYGCHLGPFKTPAKEDDPRHLGPNFYYDQEDFLRDRATTANWSWTGLRPEAVAGESIGTPMNLLMVIAVYAAISKELGMPLRFPGTVPAYDALYQMNEASLLGKAAEWAGTTPAAANQAFNITNGDAFRWRHMFPVIADVFEMPVEEPKPISLTRHMAGYGELWDTMVKRHDLLSIPYEQLASWGFGDAIFNAEYDNVRSDLKARAAGWNHFVDSEEMFRRLLSQLRARRVVP